LCRYKAKTGPDELIAARAAAAKKAKPAGAPKEPRRPVVSAQVAAIRNRARVRQLRDKRCPGSPAPSPRDLAAGLDIDLP